MILVHKKSGETPLECLMRTRLEKNIAQEVKMTYAGRLDPMAEGLMIFLIGDECKEKENYTNLPKTYEFEILTGVQTDTYDVLGVVQYINKFVFRDSLISKRVFENELFSFIGTQNQSYPSYSSKPVEGKPLFLHAREGNTVALPQHVIHIDELSCINEYRLSKQELQSQIKNKILKVQGDFRQKEILEAWSQFFKTTSQVEFQIFSCVVSCGSGTYVRQLVSDIGKKIGIPCTTFSIDRKRIGEYI